MSEHQHEEWQMLESAKGGRYCGACGDHTQEAPHQVIPDAAVEAAAKAQYWNDGLAWDDGTVPDWECEDDSLQESYLTAARAALKAAAPHLIQAAKAEAWEEGVDFVNEGVQSFSADNPYR